MYKNIVFDMGNVLTYWNTYDLVYSFCNNDKDTKIIIETLMKKWYLLLDGKVSDDELYQDTIKLAPAYLHHVIKEIIDSYYTHFIEVVGMKDLINELKELNYNIYCLSNAPSSLAKNLEKLPILNGFKDIVISGDIKMIKPNKDIYEYFLKKNNLDAKDCIFIDDHEPNIIGCENVGIKGHVFTDAKELRNYFCSIGVLK